jgi:hypothetical protein
MPCGERVQFAFGGMRNLKLYRSQVMINKGRESVLFSLGRERFPFGHARGLFGDLCQMRSRAAGASAEGKQAKIVPN